MLARAWSASVFGIDALKVGVEVDVSAGLPGVSLVGLPDAAVQESRERVKAALKNSGFAFPARKIVINLSPADIRKEGPLYDLPIAIAILAASEQLEAGLLENFLFLGELSLDGGLKPVAGVLPIAVAAREMGIRGLVVPKDNALEAAVVGELQVYGFSHLTEVVKFIDDPDTVGPIVFNPAEAFKKRDNLPDMKDVRGQHLARRALEIAAAGGHNLIFVGPPGSGKTMLARRLPGILPPLTFKESLEVSRVHSVAGLLKEKGSLVVDRPFRGPHHSASGAALVGGGSFPRPGEISLSHRGILFLDELTEFKRSVLEYLRQPLEDGFVSISRTRQSVNFPARFTLVASTNPCPCGYYGDSLQACSCSPRSREQYWAKLSGPLLDRVDLQVAVNRLKPEEMIDRSDGEDSASVRQRVHRARLFAGSRFEGTPIASNAEMTPEYLRRFCSLDDISTRILEGAIRKLGLSARAMDRVLKVARTIADLAASERIQTPHLTEAIQYRTLDRMA